MKVWVLVEWGVSKCKQKVSDSRYLYWNRWRRAASWLKCKTQIELLCHTLRCMGYLEVFCFYLGQYWEGVCSGSSRLKQSKICQPVSVFAFHPEYWHQLRATTDRYEDKPCFQPLPSLSNRSACKTKYTEERTWPYWACRITLLSSIVKNPLLGNNSLAHCRKPIISRKGRLRGIRRTSRVLSDIPHISSLTQIVL